MRKISLLNTGISTNNLAKTENISPARSDKYQDGELAHIKVLEHLGGGKLIISFKGQRIVANTNLMLENGQEMDVMVKNASNQILLSIIASASNEYNPALNIEVKTYLTEILNQLLYSLEEATQFFRPSANEPIQQLLQKIKDLIKSIPVDASGSDIAGQIKNAIEKLGFDYERMVVDAIAKNQLQVEDTDFQLKPGLLKLQSYLSEIQPGNNSIQNELMALIRNALENIESQQMNFNSDNVQNFYFQIPVMMQDDVINAELEFFRQRANNGSEDNTFSLILNLSPQLLGDITFAISIDGTNIDCHARVANSETFALIEKHSEKLRNSLIALGYKVNRIQCLRETPGSDFPIPSLHKITDKIDIVV